MTNLISSDANVYQFGATGLDKLKDEAERAAITDTLTRRPTWAPPLIIEGELESLLRKFKWGLASDELPVCRLWASFSDPRRGKVACTGFALRCGQKTNGWKAFTAQSIDKVAVLANLNRSLQKYPEQPQIKSRIAQVEAADTWTLGPRCSAGTIRRWPELARIIELAQARVLNFAGDSSQQMKEAARLTHHCCCCGKGLTDPYSVEYGIGPECRQGIDVRRLPGTW